MKKIKFTVVLALMLSVSLVGITAVRADTVTATATLLAPAGTRTLSPVAPVVLNTANSFSASFSVSVVEAFAPGVNPWWVTAFSSNFASVEGGSIAASNFAYARTAGSETQTVPAGPTAGAIQAGTNGPLSGAGQTLFTVTGEDPLSLTGYSGTYTSAGNVTLTIPAGTAFGTYTATVTITLVA